MTRADVEVVVHMTVPEAQAVQEVLAVQDSGHETTSVYNALFEALEKVEQAVCP